MPYKRDVIQYFFYFGTFSMKKNTKVKVEGFHPRSRLRSAATPQYPSTLKNLISLFLVLLLYHAFSYYDPQNSILIASVRTQSRKKIISIISHHLFINYFTKYLIIYIKYLIYHYHPLRIFCFFRIELSM
jgi:hypothetical protein